MEIVGTDECRDTAARCTVIEAAEVTPALIQTLADIDLATFSESTFSDYAAAALIRNGRVFLLQTGDRAIGSCVTVRCWDRPSEAMVLSMGIKPGWRGQGLGQMFLVAVLDKLRAKGLRSACLYVASENRRALQTYRDCGFEPVEIAKGSHDTHLQLMRVSLGEPELIELE